MSGFLKKLMAAGSVLTVGLSSFAYANYGENACCPPPCDPCASWCNNFRVDAAWLYWRVGSDGFDFATEKVAQCDSDGLDMAHQRTHALDFDKWDSGVRIGGGFDLPCVGDGWGIDLYWTHFEVKQNKHAHLAGACGSDVFFGFPSLGGFSGTLDDGEEVHFCASGKFRYDVVDLDFGKWCACGCSLRFRPFVGVRFADIEDRFSNGIDLSIPLCDISDARVHARNKFEGAGLRAGLGIDLPLFCGVSLCGCSAISSLWGKSHFRHCTVLSTDSSDDNNLGNMRASDHRPLFIADLNLGLCWKSTFFGCNAIDISLLWENHYLFNQTRFIADNSWNDSCGVGSGCKNRGDILLQGLTLKFGFDF